MTKLEELKSYLETRMEMLKLHIAKGVAPGIQDTYELQQLLGREKELCRIIEKVEGFLK